MAEGIGDRKDESPTLLQRAGLKPNVFEDEQEQEMEDILSNIGFGNHRQSERFKQFIGLFYLGEIVDVVVGVANVNVAVSHHLKEVPSGFIIIDLPATAPAGAKPALYKSNTAWTSTTANFWSAVTGTYKVWLWTTFTGR
jgi:hypothetical protein